MSRPNDPSSDFDKPTESNHSNAPIFLIHGWNMPPLIWTPLQEKLNKHLPAVRVVNGVMPGYAPAHNNTAPSREAKPIAASETSNVEDILERILATLLQQAPPNAHWCGWSLGATLAMAAALRVPERISKLTLISPTPCFIQQEDWPHGMPANTFEKLLRITCKKPELGWQRFLNLQLPDTSAIPESSAAPTRPQPPSTYPSESTLVAGKRILCEMNFTESMTSIRTPTLVLAGHHDRVVPMEASQFVADQIGGAQFECYPTSHLLPWINAAWVGEKVASFHRERGPAT